DSPPLRGLLYIPFPATNRLRAILRSCRCGDEYATRPTRCRFFPELRATPEHAGRRCLPGCRQDRTRMPAYLQLLLPGQINFAADLDRCRIMRSPRPVCFFPEVAPGPA